MNSQDFDRDEGLSLPPATPHELSRPSFSPGNPDVGPTAASAYSIIQDVSERLAYARMAPDEGNAARHQEALSYIEQNTQAVSMTRQILLTLLASEGQVVTDGQLNEIIKKNTYHTTLSVPKNILGSWLQKFKDDMPFEITRARGEGFSLTFKVDASKIGASKTDGNIHDVHPVEEGKEGSTGGAEPVNLESEIFQNGISPMRYQQALQALIEEIEENPDISKGLLPETLRVLAKEMQKRGNYSMVLKFRLERIEMLEGENQARALVKLAHIGANASDYVFADEMVQRAIKHPAISQKDLAIAYAAQERILGGLHRKKYGNIEPRADVEHQQVRAAKSPSVPEEEQDHAPEKKFPEMYLDAKMIDLSIYPNIWIRDYLAQAKKAKDWVTAAKFQMDFIRRYPKISYNYLDLAHTYWNLGLVEQSSAARAKGESCADYDPKKDWMKKRTHNQKGVVMPPKKTSTPLPAEVLSDKLKRTAPTWQPANPDTLNVSTLGGFFESLDAQSQTWQNDPVRGGEWKKIPEKEAKALMSYIEDTWGKIVTTVEAQPNGKEFMRCWTRIGEQAIKRAFNPELLKQLQKIHGSFEESIRDVLEVKTRPSDSVNA